MRTKKNRIINIILFVLFLISLVTLSLCEFCLKQWDNLNFTTIMNQLALSISGTDKGIVRIYFIRYFLPAVLLWLIVLLTRIFVNIPGRTVSINYELFDKKGTKPLSSENAITALLGTGIALIFVIAAFTRMEFWQYVDNRINPSEIFENYYVDSNEADISFGNDRKNLILIYAESMESGYASRNVGGSSEHNYIPNLVNLASENVNFSRTNKLGGGYDTKGTSDFTASAIMATSTGVPYLSNHGNDASKFGKILPGAKSLGEILNDNGYDNYFQCGSLATFGSRKEFYEQHGNYNIYDYKYSLENHDIPDGYDNGFWGYEDLYLFDIAKNNLTRLNEEGKHFNYTMLTVDTHFPNGYKCELCRSEWSNYYANSLSCSDRQISDFVEWCKEQEWFDDTVIVIIGDHTTMKEGFVPEGEDRVTYNCFIGNALESRKEFQKNRTFTSMDYFPTILSAMGATIKGDRLGLGTDLFSGKPTVTEEMGFDNYMNEINRYSRYYDRFID